MKKYPFHKRLILLPYEKQIFISKLRLCIHWELSSLYDNSQVFCLIIFLYLFCKVFRWNLC